MDGLDFGKIELYQAEEFDIGRAEGKKVQRLKLPKWTTCLPLTKPRLS